jgi:L-lactate utilization protein LutC
MDRDAFLKRVREAAHTGRRYRVHGHEAPPHVGYVGAGDDPPARLAAEIDAVGGKASLVDHVTGGRRRLTDLIAATRPASALCWEHPLLEAIDVQGALQAAGVRAISHANLASLAPDAQRSAVLAADLGIVAADWAVAETGSLVVASKPGQERWVSLLPPVLISIVDGSRIVPDLFDLFAALEGGLPSNLVLITGPSKTGDIELQLTTGVHGPGEWHVIIIREAP